MNITFENKRIKRSSLKKVLVTTSHLIGVSLLFILPEMVISVISDEGPSELTAVVYGKALVYVAVFYINYYFLVPHCLQRDHAKTRFFCYNLVLAIVAMTIFSFLWQWGHHQTPPHEAMHQLPPPPLDGLMPRHSPERRMEWIMLWRDTLVLVLTIALAVAIKLTTKWQEHERMRHEAQSIQRQSELTRLKSQLNPHFLFNTLNTIYALIDLKPEGARNAVHELSSMLRYALYDCHSTVRLSDEMRFVDSYLRLVKLRLPNEDCLRTCLDDGDCGQLMMAPLLFINIIENSLKHSCLNNADDFIDIRITANEGIVTCVCSNPYNPSASQPRKGLGLQNLKRRLELLYGPLAQLTIDKTDNRFTATLQVNISQPPAFSEPAPALKYSNN